MYKYRVLAGMEVHLPTAIVAREALKVAARELKIKAPELFFIDLDQVFGTIQHDCRVNGIAEPARRSIYIDVDQPVAQVARTVFHEVWHVFKAKNGDDRELAANAFVGRLWGLHGSAKTFVEVMRALEAIGSRTPKTDHVVGALKTGRNTNESIAEQRKLAEVRRRYYQEGIKARAECFLTPRNRGRFPADIEFFNTPIKKVVFIENPQEEWNAR